MKDTGGHGSNSRGGPAAYVQKRVTAATRKLNINQPAHSLGIHGFIPTVKSFMRDTSAAGRDISPTIMKMAGADPDGTAETMSTIADLGQSEGTDLVKMAYRVGKLLTHGE
jgi:hypothetical protein